MTGRNFNLPPGVDDDSEDAPWNKKDFEYLIGKHFEKINGYLVIDLEWEGNPPDDEILYPSKVRIPLEEICDLIDRQLGR